MTLAATPTPALTPATQQMLSDTMNMNAYFTSIISDIANLDFMVLIKILVAWLILAWILVLIWVFKDATARYNSIIFPLVWLIVVAPVNLLGLLAYVILRPSEYLKDRQQEEADFFMLQAASLDYVICPKCNSINSRTSDFCIECGNKLVQICPKCKKKTWVDWSYCGYCGYSLLDNNENKTYDQKQIEKKEIIDNLDDNLAPTNSDIFLSTKEFFVNTFKGLGYIKTKCVKSFSLFVKKLKTRLNKLFKKNTKNKAKTQDKTNIKSKSRSKKVIQEKRVKSFKGIFKKILISIIDIFIIFPAKALFAILIFPFQSIYVFASWIVDAVYWLVDYILGTSNSNGSSSVSNNTKKSKNLKAAKNKTTNKNKKSKKR